MYIVLFLYTMDIIYNTINNFIEVIISDRVIFFLLILMDTLECLRRGNAPAYRLTLT
jgi:hypothetical protein